MKKLFADAKEVKTNGGRMHDGTKQMVDQAKIVVDDVMNNLEDQHEALVKESQDDYDALDTLIDELANLEQADYDFLNEIDDEQLEKMLKSQQSKKSRTKSKTMTEANYRALLNAAICETMLRDVLDKPKVGRTSHAKQLTDEEIERLSQNKEELGKAIRNIQSKKSIYKSKADTSVEDEYYQKLLDDENKLKAVRDGIDLQAKKMQEKLAALTADVDIEKMSAKDAKELLAKVVDNAR